MNELLHTERAVVLWLVPSNTILNQTADALRDPRHAYRRALELACGAVETDNQPPTTYNRRPTTYNRD